MKYLRLYLAKPILYDNNVNFSFKLTKISSSLHFFFLGVSLVYYKWGAILSYDISSVTQYKSINRLDWKLFINVHVARDSSLFYDHISGESVQLSYWNGSFESARAPHLHTLDAAYFNSSHKSKHMCSCVWNVILWKAAKSIVDKRFTSVSYINYRKLFSKIEQEQPHCRYCCWFN